MRTSSPKRVTSSSTRRGAAVMVGDRVRAQGRIAPAAEQDGRDVADDLVDEPVVPEAAGEGRAAFEQHAHDAPRVQVGEHLLRGVGGDDGLGRVVAHLGIGRGAARAVEDDADRLALRSWLRGCRPDGQQRIVGHHRADADEDRVDPGAQAMAVAARGLPGDPPAGAVGSGDLPVEARPVLPDHERPAAAHGMQPGLVDPLRLGPQQAACDVDTCCAQLLGPAGEARVGVVNGVDDPADSRVQQRNGARAGASGLRARLEGDHGGTTARPIPRLAQRHDLGVRAAGEDVPALAGDLPFGVQDDAAHDRVRAHRGEPACGERDGAAHRGGLHALRNGHLTVLRRRVRRLLGCAARPWRDRRRRRRPSRRRARWPRLRRTAPRCLR